MIQSIKSHKITIDYPLKSLMAHRARLEETQDGVTVTPRKGAKYATVTLKEFEGSDKSAGRTEWHYSAQEGTWKKVVMG